ncbi:MAG TPA: hypothetical protein VEV81_06690 [Pyrinomonadaceae bacterium]|nr:hypothetical protein [Pyrinomonadaceae bacterium]
MSRLPLTLAFSLRSTLRRGLASPCIAAALLALLALPASAQRSHDPLNPQEVDQLRDSAQEPDVRLKLLVGFNRARLAALEQMRADPKTTDRGSKTRDMLQEFLDVFDELSDNVDMYADRKDDMRKGLKLVIEADTEFAARLRAIKDSAATTKEEVEAYRFLLDNAIETIDASANDHRKLLVEQEELAKRRKQAHPKKDDDRR